MAIITETVDAVGIFGTENEFSNYTINPGDTFNGVHEYSAMTEEGPTPADHLDALNLQGLTLGETHTISVTVQNIMGLNFFALGDPVSGETIVMRVSGGFPSDTGGTEWHTSSFIASGLTVEGNTISFDFIPLTSTNLSLDFLALHFQGAYSLSLISSVVAPAITEGDDTVTGTEGDDNLSLLGGNDIVDGLGGNDTLNGDAGDDTLTGGADNDLFVVDVAEGADVITDFTSGEDQIDLTSYGVNAIEDLSMTDSGAGVVIDFGEGNQITLNGVAADDLGNEDFVLVDNIYVGTEGNDKVNGKSGVDNMSGGAGDDQLDGKAGNDLLEGGLGKDKLSGGLGDDTAIGGEGNDLLIGDDGNDLLIGGDNNDRLHGGAGNDLLTGDSGNDKLYGDDGDDMLIGGTGKDVMSGGSGADTFVFEQGAHSDTITDFEDGADLLDFSDHMGVNSITDLAISQSGSHTVVSYGGPDQVLLQNTDMLDIDATDFIF